jgi:hypothetical protein
MSNEEGLKLMRKAFEPHQISQLPKPTKAQTDEVKQDYKKGIRCDICGAWHHPKVVHLSYVGHAALTDRLLDADPNWSWEPAAVDPNGLPAIDKDGGLWIKLTVCGVTRLGYGDAQGKTGGDAMKERIGDALRNAAMRFGAALELWHKGILHLEDDASELISQPAPKQAEKPSAPAASIPALVAAMEAATTMEELKTTFASAWKESKGAEEVTQSYNALKAKFTSLAEQP